MNKLFLIGLFVILIIPIVKAEPVLVPISKTNGQQISKNNANDVDLGPYIRNLQRTIKYNWNPPKNNVQKPVVTSFVIAKNGNLLNYVIKKSSGDKLVDEAAIMAIKNSAPFNPLPSDLKENRIEIQFIFDYNVFSAFRTK